MPSVLVVDDDPDVRVMLETYLELEGFDVLTASNGLDALQRLRDVRPSVILLDLMMPQLSGQQFRRFLSADPRLAGIPVVVVSASPTADEESQRMGAVACIHKPVDLDGMLSIIRRYLPAR